MAFLSKFGSILGQKTGGKPMPMHFRSLFPTFERAITKSVTSWGGSTKLEEEEEEEVEKALNVKDCRDRRRSATANQNTHNNNIYGDVDVYRGGVYPGGGDCDDEEDENEDDNDDDDDDGEFFDSLFGGAGGAGSSSDGGGCDAGGFGDFGGGCGGS